MLRSLILLLPLGAGCASAQAPAPEPRTAAWQDATRYLDSMVAGGAAPGALLAVSVAGHHYFHGAGRLGINDPTRPDSTTLYDLASLTKVIGLTSAVMLAVDEHRLELDSTVARYLPAVRPPITIRHLLTHSSGLPAWRPLHLNSSSRAEAFAVLDSTSLDTLPGARFLYSDLGAMLLTQAVEAVYHTRLDTLLAQRVFAPLGLEETRYLPPAEWLPRIAPTENDPWRGRLLRGEVHDENAARLDGVSGHAGLFSSGRDLLRVADWLLGATGDCGGADARGHGIACSEERSAGCGPLPITSRPPIADATIRAFTTRQDLPPGSSRALGWDTPSDGGSAGHRLSARSFGHTGFTGTSMWIDPTRCLAIVLLSNRVHPTRANSRWGPVRGEVADRVAPMATDSAVTP